MRKHLLFLLMLFLVGDGLVAQTILGLDVSHYEGTINWTQVAAAGKVFSWTKATEGTGYTDNTFSTNITNGTAAGVVMGAYHFARPETNTAVDEANYFLSVAGSSIGTGKLPPALDLEDPPTGTGLTSYFTSSALTTWAQTWMTTVQNATGIRPVLYTSGSIASYLNSSINVYPLWIANPGTSATTPPSNIGVWTTWAFKQYSWTGTVSGISGSVDLDVFNGTTTDFNNLIGGTVTPPQPTLCHNDTVCTPMTLTVNTNNTCTPYSCSTINATAESTAISFTGGNSCTSTYQSGRYDDDVWFSITPASNSPITIRAVPTSNTANFDPVIGLYSNNCSSPSQLTCKDSFGVGVTESLYYTPVANTTYLIRVFSYGIGTQYAGNFDICVFSPAPCTAPTNISFSGTQSACTGSTTNISASASNCGTGCTFNWSNSLGTGAAKNLSSGTFSVTVTNSCGSTASSTVSISTLASPNAPVITTAGSCSPVTITANSSGCSGCNYNWSTPSGLSSGSSAQGTATGTYYVTVTNGNNCTAGSSSVIPVSTVPAQSGSISGSTIVCPGASGTYSISAISGATSYTWSLPSGWSGSSTSTSINTTAGSTGGTISVVANNSCGSGTSQTLFVAVNSQVTPTINITPNPAGSICSGTNVVFTSSSTGGGNSPAYQWKKNGFNISGATSSTYSANNLATGDAITCELTSSSACANPVTALSNSITVTVNSSVTPTINISASPSGAVCAGTGVSFSSTINDGGTSPTYQWKSNGSVITSAVSSSYSSAALVNGETITCELTSNATCASPPTVISNGITANISSPVTPVVSISSDSGTTVCTGSSVTFSASPTNGGNNPSYQWKLNGNNVGTGNIYTTVPNNGDVITCEMSSSLTCVSPVTVTSNSIAMTVTSPVTPAVSISSGTGLTTCAGTTVVFSATGVNGGGAPVYQWKLNGNNITTGSNYATAILNNGDVVTCDMTTSLSCVTNATVTSNALQITVGGNITPTVQANNCELAAAFYPNVSYQWYANSLLLSGAITRFYTASQSGYYYVSITDSNLCTTQSADVFVSYPACLPTGVQDPDNDFNFEIHELSSGRWQLNVSPNLVGSNADIFNAIGQIVLKTVINNQQSELDMRTFSTGAYFIRVSDNQKKFFVKKILKL